jgi:hypothetical protein
MKLTLAKWFTPDVTAAIAVGILAAFLSASLLPTQRYVQGPDENYMARYKKVTAITWGWPARAYGVYPEGYINPGEWLAWDCEPVHTSWVPIGVGVDVLAFVVVCISSTAAVCWSRRFSQRA